MKNWHLWYSIRMPPGGTVAQSPGFLNGPRYPRIPRAGKDNQQFFPKLPGHWQVGVPKVCLPQFFKGDRKGWGPLSSLELQAPHRGSRSPLGCPASW